MPGRLLLAYSVTKSHFQRLCASIKDHVLVQTAHGKIDGAYLLQTDVPLHDVPECLLSFFDIIVPDCDVHCVYNEDRSFFSLARMRNLAFEWALAEGYDWILLCDADTILVEPPEHYPDSGFGIPKVYWQKSASESIEDSLNVVASGDISIFSQGNSWFFVSKRVFENFRFNENIVGYGFEDNDFAYRLEKDGIEQTQMDFTVIHKYHTDFDRKIDPKRFNRNRDLFDAVKILYDIGRRYREVPRIELYPAVHPHWSSNLVMVPSENFLIHFEQRSRARYTISDDALFIEWDDWQPEQFFFHDGVYYAKSNVEHVPLRPFPNFPPELPNQIHFITGLRPDFGGKPLLLPHLVALASARHIYPDYRLTVYYEYEGDGPVWQVIKENFDCVQVRAPREIYGQRITHYAHAADVLRLQLLLEKGGIYFDLDTICLRRLDELFEPGKALMGTQRHMGREDSGLCNAVIAAPRRSRFIQKWLETYASFTDDQWDYFSVKVPLSLSHKYPQFIKICPEDFFFFPSHDPESLRNIFERSVSVSTSYSIHLWESLSWNFLQSIDIASILSDNTTYNLAARMIISSTPELFRTFSCSGA